MTIEDDMDQEALFNQAMNPVEQEAPVDEAPKAEAEPQDEATQTEPEESEPVVDAESESGAAAVEEVEEEPDAPAEEQKGGVPPHRLRETAERARKAEADLEAERKARSDLEARLARLEASTSQQQQPQQAQPVEDKPDFFVDPDAALAALEQRMEERTQERFVNISFRAAERTHGDEFREAYDKLKQSGDAAAARFVMNALDPGDALIQLHRRSNVMQETGGDLAAYKAKIEAEAQERLLSDPEFLRKATEAARASAQTTTATGAPHLNIPNSVNGGARAGDSRPQPQVMRSGEEMFNEMMKR